MAAKIYLYNALREFSAKFPQLHIDLWIDDLSFDVVDRDPNNAVRIAIAAFEYIRDLLQQDNLKISEKKTGFIASNSAAKRLLKERLPQAGPGVHDTMRDLGVDCTGGRLRCIATMRNRRGKVVRKTKKLKALKIPQRAIRLKLYKGSVLAGISWGHEAMGLAPQTRKKISAVMGRQLGLQRTGSLDIVYDMNSRHQDPDYGAFMAQIRVYHRFYGNWPEATHRSLEKAWQVIHERLSAAQYPWQVAKGPVAALQCYLRDHQWEHSNYGVWTKPGHNGCRDFKLDMNEQWFELREELKRAERWERITRLNQRPMLQEIQYTMDWKPWQQLSKTLSSRDNAALLTWYQGALFTKMGDQDENRHLQCPHCGQPANALHLLWICKAANQACPSLDPEDQFEIDHGLNMEFWTQGILQLPRYQIATGGAAVQAWGNWTYQDEVKVSNVAVFTIGIAATSKDSRLRHYVVALVNHAGHGSELYRMGTVATVLPKRPDP